MLSVRLLKMRVENRDVVNYFLTVNNERILMNDLIGKSISLNYSGEINCIKCGRKTKKSFSQGFCYPCFTTAPETEECVLRPELCLAHEGIARDMEFAQTHCLIDHYVYLSYTGILKVGVTRNTQIPTRWIDQGATSAIILAKTPNRNLAGVIEVALKEHFSDKTNWRKMLTDTSKDEIDFVTHKNMAVSLLPDQLQDYIYDEDDVLQINYPVEKYPEKVKSYNFDKTPKVEGVLSGIKGQYLIFENNHVLNVRKFGGYNIELKY